MSRIGVVHLIWPPLGLQPLERFVDSYRRHPAGSDHELAFIVNGPADAPLRRRCEQLCTELEAGRIELGRAVLDLRAYGLAARALDAETLVFMNSYSEILAPGWLQALVRPLGNAGVGVVGATGSFGSQLDLHRFRVGLPSGYSTVFADREETRLGLLKVSRLSDPAARDRGRASAIAGSALMLARQLSRFGPFPAVHVRTNAFAMRRADLLAHPTDRVRSKLDAYALENGRHSITGTQLGRGRQALLVDRAGGSYEPGAWAESGTFWQADQDRLLVADNQTRLYDEAGVPERALLSALAWGSRVPGSK